MTWYFGVCDSQCLSFPLPSVSTSCLAILPSVTPMCRVAGKFGVLGFDRLKYACSPHPLPLLIQLFPFPLLSPAPRSAFTPGNPLALAVFPHLSWRPCKCTDHLDFKTVGPLFISGQAAAWFYGVIKVLTGVIKASNCTAETLGVYFKGP